jgi:superfamily II DNA/RNA helicase
LATGGKFSADAIHGDLRQRKRDQVIQGFRDKKCRILVATDVAARGLDIPHIEHVINYDLPQSPEDYIHRIGRTARAGAEGSALSFLSPGESGKWRAIQRLMHPGKEQPHTSSGGGGGGKPRSQDPTDPNAKYKPRRWKNGGKKFGQKFGKSSGGGHKPSQGGHKPSGQGHGGHSHGGPRRSHKESA